MTLRQPLEPRLNSVERIARLEAAGLAERVDALEATIAELRAATVELLVGLRGVAGSGVVARSPAARAIALAHQERRESEAAA